MCPKFSWSSLMTRMTKRPADKTATIGGSARFDIATLLKLAGEKVFARGVAYHEDEQVEIVQSTRRAFSPK